MSLVEGVDNMELFDIVTLDDDKDYSLIKMETYQDEIYCLFIEVDKEENPLENVLILKKISLPNGSFELEELGEEELLTISEIFRDQLLNEEEKD